MLLKTIQVLVVKGNAAVLSFSIDAVVALSKLVKIRPFLSLMDTQVCAAYLPFSCSPPPPRDRIIVVLLHLGSACVHADDAYAPLEPTKLMYRVTQRPQVSLFNCSQVNYANLKNPQKVFNFMLTNSQESRTWLKMIKLLLETLGGPLTNTTLFF